MSIIYKQIDAVIEEAIIKQYGNWVRECNCIVRGEGCYHIAAIDGDTVAGFAALHPEPWISPLEQYGDGFIEVIEVQEGYRRRGIASTMVKMLEDFAASYGYRQIRAWSDTDAVEALHMWVKLRYCMCPAVMLGQSVHAEHQDQQILGYYYAKMLN